MNTPNNNHGDASASPQNEKNMSDIIITQIEFTQISAPEGKALRNKKTGRYWHSPITLGYNYYLLGMMELKPYMLTPDDFEVVDAPEGWEDETFNPDTFIDQGEALKQNAAMFQERMNNIDSIPLTNKQAVALKTSYPIWAVGMSESEKSRLIALGHKIYQEGDVLTLPEEEGKKLRFYYDGDLWEVIQKHTILAEYFPSVNTLALYRKVHEQEGTYADPIPYEQGMMAWVGQYYIERGVKYECIESYNGSTAHLPLDLPRYFKSVVESTEGDTEGTESTEDTTAELGTAKNPIEWTNTMTMEAGKYYKQYGVTYYCYNDYTNITMHDLQYLNAFAQVAEV